MKIGVYFGDMLLSNHKDGGSFTFQQSIFNALSSLKNGKHEFYFFSKRDIEKVKSLERDTLFHKVKRRIFKKNQKIVCDKDIFNNMLHEKRIEIVWFPTPSYIPVDVPFFYTVWDLQHRLQSFFPEVSVTGFTFENREKYYRSIIPRAAYVFIGNDAGKRNVVDFYGVPEERVKTLPLPTPDFLFDTHKVKDSIFKKHKISKNYLFYPAQFWPHKNHILILFALKILKEKHGLGFDIVFTGSDKGNLSYIQEKVLEFGLQQNVHFLGFVSVEHLVELYKNAFALVFLSFFGPDNIPPLEAFALKCPVIAASVSGAEYQLGDAALLFDPKNEYDLVSAIKKLRDDFVLRDTIVARGLSRAKAWTAKDYVHRIIENIDEFSVFRRCWSSKEKYIHL